MKRILALIAAGLVTLAQAFPFVPLDTTNLVVTGSAQTLTLSTSTASGRVTQTEDFGQKSVLFTAVGTQTVFYRCDGVTATVNNGTPVVPGSQHLVSLAKSVTSCSVIAAGAGSTLYATVGVGQ